MKRGGPLARRSPLKATSGLKRGGQLRRTRLAAVSDQRRNDNELRRDVVMAVRARDRTCRAERLWPEVACAGVLDVHEPNARSRNQGDWLRPEDCLLICRGHHDAIHGDTRRARALGLLR